VFCLLASAICLALSLTARAAQGLADYEGWPVAEVQVVLDGVPPNDAVSADLRSLLRIEPRTEYRRALVRESIQALWDSGRVQNVRVEIMPLSGTSQAPGAQTGPAPLRVIFHVRPQVRVGEVDFDVQPPISEDELRARLNMLEPGERVTELALRTNADIIQAYLRDRGFVKGDVTWRQQLDPSGTRATITFVVTPGAQATVADFEINITGFNENLVLPSLKLQRGAPFSRATLGEDIDHIRQAIIAQGYLAPRIEEPRTEYDSATNTFTVRVRGTVGPRVEVRFSQGFEISEKRARELLPVKREGSIEYSAIVEGARRLRNSLQEEGYFFADVQPVCTVTPPLPTSSNSGLTCETLNPDELSNHTVTITYEVDRGRRFKLTDIRLTGTNKLSIDDVRGDLRTQEATALGLVPLLGYGRGYTSRELLDRDSITIETRMRELGYRRARVSARQGVSLNGENLIITFVVDEGPLTRVAGVSIRGNNIYTEDRLRRELAQTVIGGPYSRAAARADADRIINLYARNGYVDVNVDVDVVELPRRDGDEQVRLLFTITEGDKVFINHIWINGTVLTKKEAVLKAIPLREGEVLRPDNVTESERILYATDAFRQVIIRTEPAGETAAGFKRRDVIIDVEEQKPRRLDYGFGYSTDSGPLGIFEIRNSNLLGDLRQGALRVRASQRQQLVRLEYFDPRFRPYGQRQFAPLTFSVQYQRDTNVTRFFRSTIDRGNFGIVQRLDADGKPVDEFGNRAGEPTINRFTLSAETQRELSRRSRSTLFLRYRYEDVRLFNISSLLIRDILLPDRAVRLSGVGTAFVRDTRDTQIDPTRGELLTLDYSLSLRQLGANISYNKFLGTYRRYYRIDPKAVSGLGGITLAGSLTLGLADLFNPRDRDGNGLIDDTDRALPISERFFSGGSSTLRGFGFEEAGPRQAEFPRGNFFNENGDPVTLNPFTVPIGGNALAVVNFEARIPLTRSFQVVPFYDGGNVYWRASDIFRRGPRPNETLDQFNLRARWTNTVGLGLRIKTPFGPLAVDYGFLLRPPEFLIPQAVGGPATIRLNRGQIHIRFGEAF
jgi:outer membrane protein insertion porin family